METISIIKIINASTRFKLLMRKDLLDMTLTMQAESAPRKTTDQTLPPLPEEGEEVEGAQALGVDIPPLVGPPESPRPLMPTRWMRS
jgi:hypothetical protein